MIPLGVLPNLIFNEKVYFELYKKNYVTEQFDVPTLENQTTAVIDHISGKKALTVGFFTENEINHLTDVKNLIKKLFTLYYTLLFIILGAILVMYFFGDYDFLKRIAWCFIIAGGAFILIAVLMMIFDFSWLFDTFHETLFPQGNYLFNPSDSNMINMFPESFFQDFFERIMFYASMQALFYISVGGLFLWYDKKKRKN